MTFTDMDGIAHEVCVQAESLYEAVGLAIAEFRTAELARAEPAGNTEFAISVHREAITHRLRLKQVTGWATGGGKSPHDVIRRSRIRKLLGLQEGA